MTTAITTEKQLIDALIIAIKGFDCDYQKTSLVLVDSESTRLLISQVTMFYIDIDSWARVNKTGDYSEELHLLTAIAVELTEKGYSLIA